MEREPVLNVARERGTRRDTYFFHIEDGWHYHKNREKDNVLYFKCVYYERGCQGRALFDNVDGFLHTQEHNHDADLFYPDEMALRRRILARCRSLEYTALRLIYDQECHNFPNVVARVTWDRMRTPMRNAREEKFPNPPANLRGLTQILRDPRNAVITMTDDGLDNVYAGSVTDVDDCHHILFISDRMLQRMRDFSVLHSDGTFKTVPVNREFANQVFVIVGVWAHHVVYLGWALMESRTEIAYRSVLEFLQHLLGPNIALNRVITDFEEGQQNAWQHIFQCQVAGCLWHLCRCFLKNVVENHILGRMRRIPEVRRIVRLTFALGLLREDLIVRGFHLIVQHSRNEGNYVHRILRPFLTYVWTNWVSRPRKRSRMCVFGSSQRTNNCCESHNAALRRLVGTHPNIYVFIRGLLTLEQRAHNMLLALDEGRRGGRARRRSSVMNDAQLLQLSEDLFEPPGPIDQAIFRFLRRASHLMGNMVEEALQAGQAI